MLVGLGAGAFVAFVLNKLDPVFFSTSHLKQALELPVFGNLPRSAARTPPDELRPVAINVGVLVLVCVVINVVGRSGLAPLANLLG